MIERQFIAQKVKEFAIKKYIEEILPKAAISQIKLKKIPLGEKIMIQTGRPSLVVGSKGANIKDLTKTLKKRFHLENPQIEIVEIKDPFLDARLVAERISSSLERYGSARFKSIGHKAMENVMKSGALGVEIILSGKIPGARAKSWRFYQGYLKKCGEISITGVKKAQAGALLKTGIVGIKVAIMPPDIQLPDRVEILTEPLPAKEEKEIPAIKKGTKKAGSKRKSPARKKKKKETPEGESTPAEVPPASQQEEQKVQENKQEESSP